ncbi:Hypothetical protein PMT_2716 [Prochlorococcus marinus str. MIT 9313]|uniref:Uncharacterized protein n=1 Tax=Prochlorococcus marinus (strain MIT 9313) TaxID=74547 RepID=B9ES99_PROMM|nr:Hypothetical protein PMT_2716 [Prochlorococcus marinus str. MIT 9313]
MTTKNCLKHYWTREVQGHSGDVIGSIFALHNLLSRNEFDFVDSAFFALGYVL